MTRLRLPLFGEEAEADAEPAFDALPREALLAPPCVLVAIAGPRGARAQVAAALVRSLAEVGVNAAMLSEPRSELTRAALDRALDASASRAAVVVSDGNAILGVYRATLSLLVGAPALGGSASMVNTSRADRARRALRDRVDIEVEAPSAALLAGLARVVQRVACGVP